MEEFTEGNVSVSLSDYLNWWDKQEETNPELEDIDPLERIQEDDSDY